MKKRAGFTLVELSIVLVILGLLVGGVLTGQSLIRAAELRSITTQQSRFHAAVMTFRDKYMAIPGDMNNATNYWGIAAGTGNDAACNTAVSTTPATCNGDGDGKLFNITGSIEYFRFWQHLANAGLVEGTYTGTTDGSNTYSNTSKNVPTGRLGSSLWQTAYWGTISSNAQWFNGEYGNALMFGGMIPNYDAVGAILKPEEAYNIDMKMDDGKPALGKVVVRVYSDLAGCTTTSNPATLTAEYRLNSTALGCALVFPRLF